MVVRSEYKAEAYKQTAFQPGGGVTGGRAMRTDIASNPTRSPPPVTRSHRGQALGSNVYDTAAGRPDVNHARGMAMERDVKVAVGRSGDGHPQAWDCRRSNSPGSQAASSRRAMGVKNGAKGIILSQSTMSRRGRDDGNSPLSGEGSGGEGDDWLQFDDERLAGQGDSTKRATADSAADRTAASRHQSVSPDMRALMEENEKLRLMDENATLKQKLAGVGTGTGGGGSQIVRFPGMPATTTSSASPIMTGTAGPTPIKPIKQQPLEQYPPPGSLSALTPAEQAVLAQGACVFLHGDTTGEDGCLSKAEATRIVTGVSESGLDLKSLFGFDSSDVFKEWFDSVDTDLRGRMTQAEVHVWLLNHHRHSSRVPSTMLQDRYDAQLEHKARVCSPDKGGGQVSAREPFGQLRDHDRTGASHLAGTYGMAKEKDGEQHQPFGRYVVSLSCCYLSVVALSLPFQIELTAIAHSVPNEL
jgi:hypothetical protein